MNNLISTVEISITDFARAVKFYQTVLDISIEEMEMDGNQKKKKGGGGGGGITERRRYGKRGFVKGNYYKPTTDGAVLYLNAGTTCNQCLTKLHKMADK